MKKILAIVVAVLALTMIFSGCSKHKSSAETPVVSSSDNTPQTADDTQAARPDDVDASDGNADVNVADVKDCMKFLFDKPSGLSVDASQEKTDPARGLYYPTGGVYKMVSDGEYTYMLTEIDNNATPKQCVYKAESDGGKPEYLFDGPLSGNMMIHDGWIYALDTGGIIRITTDGTKKESLLPAVEDNDFEILDVTQTSVYFQRHVRLDAEDVASTPLPKNARYMYSRFYRMNLDGTGVEMLPLDYATFDKDEIRAQMYDGYLYYALGKVMEKNVLGRVRVDGQNNQILSDNLYGDWVVYGNAVYNICVKNNAVFSGNYTNRIDKITEQGVEMAIDLGKDFYEYAKSSGYYDGIVFGYDLQTGKTAEPEMIGNRYGYDMDQAKGWWKNGDVFLDVNNEKIYRITPRDGVAEQ